MVASWLKAFRSATTQMSSTKTPTLSHVHAIFCGLQDELKDILRALLNSVSPNIKRGLTMRIENLVIITISLMNRRSILGLHVHITLNLNKSISWLFFWQFSIPGSHMEAWRLTMPMTKHSQPISKSQKKILGIISMKTMLVATPRPHSRKQLLKLKLCRPQACLKNASHLDIAETTG